MPINSFIMQWKVQLIAVMREYDLRFVRKVN